MKKILLLFSAFLIVAAAIAQPKAVHNLAFDSLATRWDEAMPLGNGWLGALIWQKENKLRISIDRVDLWDDRPMPEIDKLRFNWVQQKVKANQYDSVQKLGDEPYEKFPAPTKIPGAAIEFDMDILGKVVSNTLDISTGLHEVKFTNGVVCRNYVHASKQVGYFAFENMKEEIIPALIVPNYVSNKTGVTGNSVEGQGLQRLGYKKGTVTRTGNTIRYHQPTWNNGFYEVLISWEKFPNNLIIGQWTISNNKPATLDRLQTTSKEPTYWPSHVAWWNDYWKRSSIAIPDALLERQYYLDMYKFGCVARSNTPPISLQAIWTADNGNLPPWKGDFHHDLNTQLSYWPGYTGNHLDLTAGFTNWLWKVMPENKRWTKQYFGLDGLNVPGVTTISGKPMGGWIQYSMSPTTVAWLSQHFYWQWKYSMDPQFLKEKCYPYFGEAANYLSALLNQSPTHNTLPLSSSPEYHDNSIDAWFSSITNFDLALLQSFYKTGAEVTGANNTPRPTPWLDKKMMLPRFDTNSTGLTVAQNQNLASSHRHHSPYMAIYPMQLLSVKEDADKRIINQSLRWMEQKGTRNWVGYSFSWAACLYAVAKESDSAVSMLQKFASNFCSPNSFHLNGDQKGGQYASATYRPFTLEGNFAFAQGIHELLIQSHHDYIEVFPATPESWKDVSFKSLRTEGAFLVSANKQNGVVQTVSIVSTAGGLLRIKLPFTTWLVKGADHSRVKVENGITSVETTKGQQIIFQNWE